MLTFWENFEKQQTQIAVLQVTAFTILEIGSIKKKPFDSFKRKLREYLHRIGN